MTASTALIKMAQKHFGLDDDTYRAKLTVITGKASTKLMSESERQLVVDAFKREGFQPIARRPAGQRMLTGKYAKKLQALWIAGWNLGIVQDRNDSAMLAFVKRQTCIDHTQFLHNAHDSRKAIEGLKAWLSRDGGVDWANLYPHQPDGPKIAFAQFKRLGDDAVQFFPAVEAITSRPYSEIDDKGWIVVMNHFGRKIRAQKAGA